MQKKIIYEQPLNERVRTFLRLEFLFSQALYFLENSSTWNCRAALSSLLDIISIFGRTDLKAEILKELERQSALLGTLENKPGVDKERLGGLLDEIDVLVDRLHATKGQIGQELRHNEFLNSIKQRSSIPGGTCDFDLPGYHYWLEQPAEHRYKDLRGWLSYFDTVRQSIDLILRLIRQSAVPTKERAQAGFHQQTLDPSLPCQLVRVALPAHSPYVAEVSGGKHRFTVRFLHHTMDGRTVQADNTVEFELTCCVI